MEVLGGFRKWANFSSYVAHHDCKSNQKPLIYGRYVTGGAYVASYTQIVFSE